MKNLISLLLVLMKILWGILTTISICNEEKFMHIKLYGAILVRVGRVYSHSFQAPSRVVSPGKFTAN